MTDRTAYVLRMVAAQLAATLFVAVTFFGVGFRRPLTDSLEPLAIALLYSTCIGTPCSILLPRATQYLWRFAFPLNWILLSVVIYAIAVAGSVLANGLLIGAGYMRASDFADGFFRASRYAVITTLTFGIGISAYEMVRSRLDETQLLVRTKERDEAEARRLAAEAQLASLESRVQPHFLFNTLNSIASLIPSDPKGAERMTAQLASLLRSSLDVGDNPLVPLDRELRTVRDYLEIERVRFGERLTSEFAIDENAAGTLVPRFSLQTLVENAVKYAIAPRRSGGRISVRAAAGDSRVRVEVEDDGPGFEPGAVPPNHGLALLRQRLALTYGNRAALDIRSAPGQTLVIVEVPKSA